MRTAIEIGAHVPAMLIGGDLDGVFVQVRLGLNGLPRFLVFPKIQITSAAPLMSDEPFVETAREFTEDRYRLYDDVPAKYLHESEWGGNDDDDGPHEDDPIPRIPDVLLC